MTALIEFRDVELSFGETLVLGGLNFSVRRGEIVCLVGPSGCGKTTALRVASGLTAPTRGEVRFDGARVEGPRRDVAIVFQDYAKALLPWRTAAGNVSLALEAMSVPRGKRAQRVGELLDRVGLLRHAFKYPSEMSGGMQPALADRPLPRPATPGADDGRAVRRARRDDAAIAARRDAADRQRG